jgi:hypothetical protein
LATSRTPTVEEVRVLANAVQQRSSRFRQDNESAKALVSIGDTIRDESIEQNELAVWTSVTMLILNLDEAITRN